MAKDTERTEIGQRLVELRKKVNKTQTGIANAIEIKRDTYARYETDTELPLPILKKLCEFYKVTSDYIIFGNENNVYNIGDNSRVYQPTFSTKIGYNTEIDNEEWVLSEEEQKLIDSYRRLPEDERNFILSSIRGLIEFKKTIG